MKYFIILLITVVTFMQTYAQNNQPKALNKPHSTKIHGLELIDDFYWLRDKTNPEVIEYLNQENEFTYAQMNDTKDLQETLYQEFLGRIKEDDQSIPVKIDDFYYYSRTEKGKNYRIYCRKYQSLDSKEEIYLDENELAFGSKFFHLGVCDVSPNHKLLAYSIDTTGYETFTLYIKDLETGKLLNDIIGNTSPDLEWASDNTHFYYTTLSEIQQSDKVWRHEIGTDSKIDKMLYHEQDAEYFLNLGQSKDKKYIFISIGSKDESEYWYIKTNDIQAGFKLMHKRESKLEYFPEHHGDKFYIVTNYQKAKNFKIMYAPDSNPDIKNWLDFLPYDETHYIQSIELFKDFLVIHDRENGYKSMNIFDFETKKITPYKFPEVVSSYGSHQYPDFNSNILRFSYSSMITPSTTFEYNLNSKELKTLKVQEIPSGYDKNLYTSERIYAKSYDGTMVPISVLYRKELNKNGINPCLLYSYGSYGYSTDPNFSTNILSLVDRGFVYAIAHIRGGSEMGYTWYENGKMLSKINTFKDFIAAAEKLIEDKFTSKEHLAISGGSAGGLLMGAVLNMRPDLYKAAIVAVPFVDVINTMLDETIPLTVAEYAEWGNPNEKQYFDYMYLYSPYNNIKKGDYPNILITAGLNDPRVGFWEPAKFTAKLRTMKTDNNTLLLKTNMGAGHGGSSGRYEYLRDKSFEYAFLLKYLSIKSK